MQASMMSTEQLEAYLQFLRSIAVVTRDSPSSLQDITEAACKRAWLTTTKPGGDPAAALTEEQIPMLPCPSGAHARQRAAGSPWAIALFSSCWRGLLKSVW